MSPAARGARARRPAPRPVARVTAARLMAEAERARRGAYAPYSRFSVGAALATRHGKIIHGCNVENASFGLTICAERNAVFRAVGEGERDFVAVAVAARKGHEASPCGSCRQVLHEFAPRMQVYWRDRRGRIVSRRLDTLLDRPFDLARSRRR